MRVCGRQSTATTQKNVSSLQQIGFLFPRKKHLIVRDAEGERSFIKMQDENGE